MKVIKVEAKEKREFKLYTETLPDLGKKNVHFSSATDEWATPPETFAMLQKAFGKFTLDPCATAQNAKCPEFFTKEENGLTQPWGGHRVFCNPPYGRSIGDWIKKGYEESFRAEIVVMLIPARPDTAYWHEYVTKGYVRFLKGRIRFIGAGKHSAPFPSAVVAFGALFNH